MKCNGWERVSGSIVSPEGRFRQSGGHCRKLTDTEGNRLGLVLGLNCHGEISA